MQESPLSALQGGSIITVGTMDAVKNATANFYANVTDPKASLLTTLNWDLGIVSDGVPLNGA